MKLELAQKTYQVSFTENELNKVTNGRYKGDTGLRDWVISLDCVWYGGDCSFEDDKLSILVDKDIQESVLIDRIEEFMNNCEV